MRQRVVLVDRRLARGLTIVQAVVIPVAALLAYFIAGAVAAKSAALGAFLCWLGSAYFAWQAFRQGGAKASKQVLGHMYQGLIGKFVIVVVGFVVIFRSVKPILMEALLGGFVLVQLMAWIYPMCLSHWMSRKKPVA